MTLIVQDMRPWLIEVNSSPDMSKNAPVLRKIVFEVRGYVTSSGYGSTRNPMRAMHLRYVTSSGYDSTRNPMRAMHLRQP